MHCTRRGLIRGLIAAVAATALPIASRWTPTATAAPPVADPSDIVAPRLTVTPIPPTDPALSGTPSIVLPTEAGPDSPEWTIIGPETQIGRVFTPASGPLLATTETDLLRTDDVGATWEVVTTPAPRFVGALFEVDPTDHRVIYVDTIDGLKRTEDDGASWTPILPADRRTIRMAISPADPRVLYAAQVGDSGGDFWLLRSTDRGATWDELDRQTQAPCGWSVLVLAPHQADPSRLFRTAGCYAGRNTGDDLEESRDGGQTWTTSLAPRTAFPRALVGGSSAEPGRFYAAVNNDARSGGSILFASADDAATWTPVLEHQGGGTMTGAQQPSVAISALAYDPAMPSRAFVALQRKLASNQHVDAAWVSMTTDGGTTWSRLGQEGPDVIPDLALGIDGLNLFAATSGGTRRFSLC